MVKINPIREFRVTLRFKDAAWDEHDGIPYDVFACDKRGAIWYTKKLAERDGHTTGRGRVYFKAEEI